MDQLQAGFHLHLDDQNVATLAMTGNWVQGQGGKSFAQVEADLLSSNTCELTVDGSGLGSWDSALMACLLRFHNACTDADIVFKTREMPEGIDQLLGLATAVKPHKSLQGSKSGSLLSSLNPMVGLRDAVAKLAESLGFIGEVMVALSKLASGKANTRLVDFWSFVHQAGPNAFGIISLTSVLVGMILAYLGAVQLQQFGAEIYVADLVVIGTLREMGVLMTAVVMSGRTGAAYAAQLGTMQTNEEIDAITTMGISPMEFLVIPRMLALVAVMPLLTLYANVLGVFGGSLVAAGMGISPLQYLNQTEAAITFTHIFVGLFKSIIFGVLIAIAGCRAGINSGRSSAAVGEAATKAVVTAIIYLIVADATINILFQQLGI
ncbi:MAG: phospholipid/cholesterol/gamma-HCH transport system permease protein [Halioglobus sp.]|jgi:phospholipid/cholesterol/gamma-HCH transport system permease protein